MKFLLYKGGRIELNYIILHDLSIQKLVDLRNQLSDIGKLRKLDLEASVKFMFPDFQTIWINPPIERGFIESLNSMIIKRKTKVIK